MQKSVKTKSIRERFPSPWTVMRVFEGLSVSAANGKRVAYIYSEEEPIRREILKYPDRKEAYALANAIASLPELITKLEGGPKTE